MTTINQSNDASEVTKEPQMGYIEKQITRFEHYIFGFALFLNYGGLLLDMGLYFYTTMTSVLDLFFDRLEDIIFVQDIFKCVPCVFLVTLVWIRSLQHKQKAYKLVQEKYGHSSKQLAVFTNSFGYVLPLVIHTFALIFSMIGDYFMEWREVSETRFLMGIGGFAIGQVFYAWSFSYYFKTNHAKTSLRSFYPIRAIIYFGIGSGIIYYLYLGGRLKGVILPGATIYGLCIALMGWRAASSSLKNKYEVYRFVGAIIFMISDTIIGITTFRDEMVPASFKGHPTKLAIMITYWVAQILFAWSSTEFAVEHTQNMTKGALKK